MGSWRLWHKLEVTLTIGVFIREPQRMELLFPEMGKTMKRAPCRKKIRNSVLYTLSLKWLIQLEMTRRQLDRWNRRPEGRSLLNTWIGEVPVHRWCLTPWDFMRAPWEWVEIERQEFQELSAGFSNMKNSGRWRETRKKNWGKKTIAKGNEQRMSPRAEIISKKREANNWV